MKNAINWFEIPVTNMDRAAAFYSTILGTPIEAAEMGGGLMAMLPYESGANGGVGGALYQGDGYAPGANGPLIYLNGGDDLSTVLDRVAGAGGSVITPKTDIGGGNGFYALFLDSEGNKLGLHSMG